MSKKSTSVSFEGTTIEIVNAICKATQPTASFNKMVEHLVITNPKYITHVESKKNQPTEKKADSKKNNNAAKKSKKISRNRRNL